ncbi:RusA family crossover junction endodeoxyribonuclease [Campylobacter fetus]|nr:RusA family crossover junction endodeoxyribonuclease [Campylobacter fetus]
MDTLKCFTIHIKPVAAARPRVSKYAVYYPKTYTKYKNNLKSLLKNEIKKPYDGFLLVDFEFYFKHPKSWTKTQKAIFENDSRTWHTKKPDIDNLSKGVMDALNNLAYKDDAQVVCLVAKKFYGLEDKIMITIKG